MKPHKRIVITGIGIISNIGIGKDNYWNALMQGVSGISEITLFDTTSMDVTIGGEIRDFEPKEFLGKKGLRLLDRTTKLVCSASKAALDNSGIEFTDDNNMYETGLVLGTTLGCLQSSYNFQKDVIFEGPHYVNPALFPHLVYNSPASHISIRFSIKGLNATIATGYTAGFDAIGYAINFIKLGRLKRVVVGAVETLSLPCFMGFYKSNLMVSEKDLFCPFDKRRNGFVLGEGSAMFVIEDLETALARNAPIYGEIRGLGTGSALDTTASYRNSAALQKALKTALRESFCEPQDIDYICAHANATKEADRAEAEAIGSAFGHYSDTVPVSSIKSMIGETFSAGGAMALGAVLGAIEKEFLPPTINYREKDPECNLNCIVNKSQKKVLRNVMINSINPGGNSVSIIVSRYNAK